MPHLPLAVLQVLALPRRVKLWVRKSCTEVWAQLQCHDLTNGADLQKIPSSDTSVGHFTKGGDEAGEDSEGPAVGNAVPKFIAEEICIGIMDCAKRTERFPKQVCCSRVSFDIIISDTSQPHIVVPGYKFTITVVDQMEAKGQDILICFTTDGDPVASWNKEARGLQVTADGRVQDIVEYVQSVLCSECPM